MKKYKFQLSILGVFTLVFLSIMTYIWIQNTRSIYTQIESSMRSIDANYSEILDVHIDNNHNLVFYLTNNERIGMVSLRKTLTGFKLKSHINNSEFIDDKDISWHGTEKTNDDIHLLYGKVQNSETTQIIIVSEGNQSANIIKNGSHTFWYFLSDDELDLPITIQTFDKDGKKLYETGDINYWNEIN